MNKFYKERVYPFKICKECGTEFRPNSLWKQQLGLCYPHRQAWMKKQYLEYTKPYLEAHPEIKARNYLRYKEWVATHLEQRQEAALRSYHHSKRKRSNRMRRHRRTKFISPS